MCYSHKQIILQVDIYRILYTTAGTHGFITWTTMALCQTCICPLHWLKSKFFQSSISYSALRDWQAIFRVTDLSFGKWWCQMFHWLSPFTTWSFSACVHSLQCVPLYICLPSWFFNLFVCSLMFNPFSVRLTWCRADERMELVWISRLFMTVPLAHSSFLVPVQEI